MSTEKESHHHKPSFTLFFRECAIRCENKLYWITCMFLKLHFCRIFQNLLKKQSLEHLREVAFLIASFCG
jgi:hypothetical protein